MAPLNKKPTVRTIGKSGVGALGKSTSGKSSGTKAPKVSSGLGTNSGGKSSSGFGPSSSKIYPSSFTTPKSSKPTASFSILWIPSKRRNKKKEMAYSSHNYDYDRGKYERSPSMYKFMSGDSTEYQPHKKKEEEAGLLVPEKYKAPVVAVATASSTMPTLESHTENNETNNTEEKQGFIQRDKDESKEAAGDTNENAFGSNKEDDYLEIDKSTNKSEQKDKEQLCDNVDSVYLRPLPPNKMRSNTSTVEEEGCGFKCLYYTLQCCDCVLM